MESILGSYFNNEPQISVAHSKYLLFLFIGLGVGQGSCDLTQARLRLAPGSKNVFGSALCV